MKIDMHCHTKEGSIDAKVSIAEYINKLSDMGFDGMLVTDHNSYSGYSKYLEIKDRLMLKHPFTVFKGIEYDTSDSGHIIVILPETQSEKFDRFIQTKGMRLRELEKIVHHKGGVIGAAHPFGTGFFAFMNTRFGKKNEEFINRMDFIETYNSCTMPYANNRAKKLARKYCKMGTGGSDAHKHHIVGSAFTEIAADMHNNTELINAIKEKKVVDAGCSIIDEVKKKKNFFIVKTGIIGYWVYNKMGAVLNKRKIRNFMREIL